jgi:hypothetical protein
VIESTKLITAIALIHDDGVIDTTRPTSCRSCHLATAIGLTPDDGVIDITRPKKKGRPSISLQLLDLHLTMENRYLEFVRHETSLIAS